MKKNFYLSTLPQDTVFKVPEGYFDSFYNRLLPKLNQTNTKSQPFFDAFPLADYSVLNELNTVVFETPEDYFGTLPARILHRIQHQQATLPLDFSALDATFLSLEISPFQVPAHYFEELPARLFARLQESETKKELDFSALEESSELGILANLPRHNVFATPEGYFENLSAKISEQTEVVIPSQLPDNEPASVPVEPKTRNLVRRVFGYGASIAAAVVLLLIGINVYHPSQPERASSTCPGRLLCDVSDAELAKYLKETRLHEEVLTEVEREDSLQVSQSKPDDLPANT